MGGVSTASGMRPRDAETSGGSSNPPQTPATIAPVPAGGWCYYDPILLDSRMKFPAPQDYATATRSSFPTPIRTSAFPRQSSRQPEGPHSALHSSHAAPDSTERSGFSYSYPPLLHPTVGGQQSRQGGDERPRHTPAVGIPVVNHEIEDDDDEGDEGGDDEGDDDEGDDDDDEDDGGDSDGSNSDGSGSDRSDSDNDEDDSDEGDEGGDDEGDDEGDTDGSDSDGSDSDGSDSDNDGDDSDEDD